MPLVRLKGTVSDPMYIGAYKRHLKFRLCDESGNINCIMWNTEKKVENGSIMNVIGYLKDNTYRGRNAVQLDVKNLFEEEEL